MQNLSDSSIEKLTDDFLVRIAQDGAVNAFAELMRRHQVHSYRLAINILHDHGEAEDQVQNAFWQAFEHLDQFQGQARFQTWLNRIVINQCLVRLRQIKRVPTSTISEQMEPDHHEIVQVAESRPTPEQEFGQQEVSVFLHREIGGIPPLLRSVFVLSDVQQLPMVEVAKRLDISVSAAKSRLLRSRLELRIRLAKYTTRRGFASLLA